MTRIVETTLAVSAIVLLLVLLGPAIGFGFSYPAPYENEPLTNSIKVTSISSNSLSLADGRVISIDTTQLLWNRSLSESGERVEVKELGSGSVLVYAKQRALICGTGRPVIILRLFPQRYPKYHRYLLGHGTLK